MTLSALWLFRPNRIEPFCETSWTFCIIPKKNSAVSRHFSIFCFVQTYRIPLNNAGVNFGIPLDSQRVITASLNEDRSWNHANCGVIPPDSLEFIICSYASQEKRKKLIFTIVLSQNSPSYQQFRWSFKLGPGVSYHVADLPFIVVPHPVDIDLYRPAQ